MSELQDRARGCLAGGAAGDALGGPAVLAPADLMADVTAEVFDEDRRRYDAHRDIVDVLVR